MRFITVFLIKWVTGCHADFKHRLINDIRIPLI
jgi:hypothetical protein